MNELDIVKNDNNTTFVNRSNDIVENNVESTLNTSNLSDSFVDRFFSKINDFIPEKVKNFLIVLSTLLLLFTSLALVFYYQSHFEQLREARMNTLSGQIFSIFAFSLLIFQVCFFLFTVYLYFKYKPIASVSDNELPNCTVIVPAFNEGEQVWHTLKSLANSDYPSQKLQILAIDDGSEDDTWYWMQQAKLELGDRLSIYQQPHNMGKRHALYRGFNIGSGDVFVTVDSDSIVLKNTMRNLVSPFVVNPNCGAVAGNVKVLNKNAIIPKMLNVSFVFSFEFVRSAESMLGSVLSTPGALSAYRRDAVFVCLEDWINQTFMGSPSDIGEDRAMTNMILKQGFQVLFQRNANVLTNVPEKYRGLYRMFIRWGRSNVRENIAMANFVFKNFRNQGTAGTRLLFVNQWVRILLAYPVLLSMLIFTLTHPILFLSSTLSSILMLSSIPVFFYAKRYSFTEAFWAYSYGVLYAFGLFWITPYSIVTASKSGWLTRSLAEKTA